jgi:hypothetical protein
MTSARHGAACPPHEGAYGIARPVAPTLRPPVGLTAGFSIQALRRTTSIFESAPWPHGTRELITVTADGAVPQERPTPPTTAALLRR